MSCKYIVQIVSFLFLIGCVAYIPDNGFILNQGKTIKLGIQTPIPIIVDGSTETNEVEKATNWIEDQVGRSNIFRITDETPSHNAYQDVISSTGYITIQVIHAETAKNEGGDALLDIDPITNEMTGAVISIDYDLAADPDAYQVIMRHELLHCLLLDDDPVSNSIMSFKIVRNTFGSIDTNLVITEHDRRLIRSLLH